MESFYFPVRNGRPILLHVNGREVLLLSNNADAFQECPLLQPFDRLESVDEVDDDDQLLEVVAQETGMQEKQIVLVPPDARVEEVVEALKSELPWLH